MLLFVILKEKQPPSQFFGSSHIGNIPFLIKNNMQFFIIWSGKLFSNAITSSTVETSVILI